MKGNAMTDENEQLNTRAALLLNDPTQPETEAEITEAVVAVFSCESGDLTRAFRDAMADAIERGARGDSSGVRIVMVERPDGPGFNLRVLKFGA